MKSQSSRHMPNRRSIRLKGYDYSAEGLYFITICCHNRIRLFGHVTNGNVDLNDAGIIAETCWLEIPDHFTNVLLHEYIIMPNHIHGIIEIVRANVDSTINGVNVDSNINGVNIDLNINRANVNSTVSGANVDSPLRSPSKTIGSIIRGYKIGVTKWMRQNTDVHDVWQRNYYEHIIQNELAYARITEYIKTNPIKWQNDKFYSK